jgi:hypothetical protein
MLSPEAAGNRALVQDEIPLVGCDRSGNAPLVHGNYTGGCSWTGAIGLGHSMRKDIRYGTGGFKRMLVDYTGAMGTLLRLCDMFNKDNIVHLGRVGLGE